MPEEELHIRIIAKVSLEFLRPISVARSTVSEKESAAFFLSLMDDPLVPSHFRRIVSTGQGAARTTRSATLPRKK